jgi:hypothetical protein
MRFFILRLRRRYLRPVTTMPKTNRVGAPAALVSRAIRESPGESSSAAHICAPSTDPACTPEAQKGTPEFLTPSTPGVADTDHEDFLAAYRTAQYLRSLIRGSHKTSCAPWPPSSAAFTNQRAEEMIPPLLLCTLAWLYAAQELSINAFKKLPEATRIRVLSIAQDLLYTVSSGRIEVPKHFALGE